MKGWRWYAVRESTWGTLFGLTFAHFPREWCCELCLGRVSIRFGMTTERKD